MSKLCGPQRRVDVGLERVVEEVGIELKAVSATMSTTMRVALRTGRPAPRGEPHGALSRNEVETLSSQPSQKIALFYRGAKRPLKAGGDDGPHGGGNVGSFFHRCDRGALQQLKRNFRRRRG
ncbi:hypothetical protein IAG25_31440 [Caballeronia sp. EK]|uniref:hypothetical protein n=1 Tax=Caballeronia sp. EK TaxID=2767469 RepID=UPI001655FC35|nr:hypothetical protein [Caballeronia sp. EK]MBC8641336.1 hypothetical protein [Caballeronia sp. EK]